MSPTKSGQSILRRENIGFSIIIFLVWLVEVIQLPHLIYGDLPSFNWLRVIVRTGIVLAVWLWVHLTTRRLLQRLYQLEEFLLVCSWCRKVGHEGQWLTMEDYFGSNFSTPTSHGICPDCAKTLSKGLHDKLEEAMNPDAGP